MCSCTEPNDSYLAAECALRQRRDAITQYGENSKYGIVAVKHVGPAIEPGDFLPQQLPRRRHGVAVSPGAGPVQQQRHELEGDEGADDKRHNAHAAIQPRH